VIKRVIDGKQVEGTQEEWDAFDKALKSRTEDGKIDPVYLCSGMSKELASSFNQYLCWPKFTGCIGGSG
jgi:hypothetical protein